jgi:translation initiation factor 2 alpha subunit (eIF-2alpha)
MKKCNQDIKNAMKQSKVYTWEVAEQLEIHENTLYRKMRKELSEQFKDRIYDAIENLRNR